MPIFLCIWRVLKRRFTTFQERPDLPQGCPEWLNWRYMLKLLLFPFIGRKTLCSKLRKAGHKKLFYLRSAKEVKTFLDVQRKFASAPPRRQETYSGQMVSVRA